MATIDENSDSLPLQPEEIPEHPESEKEKKETELAAQKPPSNVGDETDKKYSKKANETVADKNENEQPNQNKARKRSSGQYVDYPASNYGKYRARSFRELFPSTPPPSPPWRTKIFGSFIV